MNYIKLLRFSSLSDNFKTMAQDAAGMRWKRSRNQNGELRKKRDDTLIKTIEKQYNINLWVRWDMELWNYLKKNDIESLNDLINWK